MKRIFTIAYRDILHIVRDKSVLFIFLIPVLFWFILKFVPPLYEPYLPVLKEYRIHFLAMFCILSSVLQGFVLSFINLEEKDENLIPLFNILPIGIHEFMLIRTSIITIFGFVFCFLLIATTGFVSIGWIKTISLSLMSSITGPAIACIITSVSKNKIEGVTFFKLFSLIIIIPAAGLFIHSKLAVLFGIMPYYWIYSAFAGNGFFSQTFTVFVAIGYNLLFSVIAFKLFIYKMRR